MRTGLVAATVSGRAAAGELVRAWPGQAEVVDGAAGAALRTAFTTYDQVVAFLAVGAAVRALAPLLADPASHKSTDPPVVCVDEARRYAVALLGAHHGADDLAREVTAVLGGTPVITTASEAANTAALDSFGAHLGLRAADPAPLARVGTAVVSGAPVRLSNPAGWPLPPLPPNVSARAESPVAAITIGPPGDDHPDGQVSRETTLRYHAPDLVVGVGSARGVTAAEVHAVIDAVVHASGRDPAALRAVATVDLKANEAGIVTAACERGLPLVTYPAAELATEDVPTPSATVAAAVGTPSVAEAAALRAARDAGRAAELLVAKHVSAHATAALARLRPRGRLAVVGLGPGSRDLLTPAARTELTRSSAVVGLDQYVEQVRDLLRAGTEVHASGLGQEEERARTAVRLAAEGRAVALIGSGDAGVYAMAAPALEMAGTDIEVVGVPGITAATAAAHLLGAPLGHDHALISLSDLHTPWEVIERRVRAAAEADLVVCFYNPRSRIRDRQLPRALEILAACRLPHTPVGTVREATRAEERATITSLSAFDPTTVDMRTLVIVGSTQSRVIAGRFVTPRGYTWSPHTGPPADGTAPPSRDTAPSPEAAHPHLAEADT